MRSYSSLHYGGARDYTEQIQLARERERLLATGAAPMTASAQAAQTARMAAVAAANSFVISNNNSPAPASSSAGSNTVTSSTTARHNDPNANRVYVTLATLSLIHI